MNSIAFVVAVGEANSLFPPSSQPSLKKPYRTQEKNQKKSFFFLFLFLLSLWFLACFPLKPLFLLPKKSLLFWLVPSISATLMLSSLKLSRPHCPRESPVSHGKVFPKARISTLFIPLSLCSLYLREKER